jgi:hypothetical protein
MASNLANPAENSKKRKAISNPATNAKKSKSVLGTSFRSVSIHTEEEDEGRVEQLIQRTLEGKDELWEDENEEEEADGDGDDKAELSETPSILHLVIKAYRNQTNRPLEP